MLLSNLSKIDSFLIVHGKFITTLRILSPFPDNPAQKQIIRSVFLTGKMHGGPFAIGWHVAAPANASHLPRDFGVKKTLWIIRVV